MSSRRGALKWFQQTRIDYADHFECEDCDTDDPCNAHEQDATDWHLSQQPDKDR